MVRVEFPSWFYSALAIAGLVPLVKARLTPEGHGLAMARQARRGWARAAGAAAVQRQGRQRAEALAEGSVELAQAMVPLAGALARGGG